jgi:hypothetical protein
MKSPYIATGKITTLEHEFRDDAVEGRALVAEAHFARTESSEVLSGLRNGLVEKNEVDAAGLVCQRGSVNFCREERCGVTEMQNFQ